MREIGGYLELDRYSGSLFHEGAVALNCGRNCLAYLIKTKKIEKLYLPYLCCDSITQRCRQYGVEIERYHIRTDFRPLFKKDLGSNEWLYIINFYGQIGNDELVGWKEQFGRVIFDNAQAYFQKPSDGVDTLYTCRKFFGVPDGAFLYTADKLDDLERDVSYTRMRFVLGRFERTANEFYSESVDNNSSFAHEKIKRMSKLTENLLRAIDYGSVEKKRTDNFQYLHEQLKEWNELELTVPHGAYMYPFYFENGARVRKDLQAMGVYIPTLWPEVTDACSVDALEYDYAGNILPLPVDQRYEISDMEYMIRILKKSMEDT